jgi:murein L,D-transpeptidase YcbB/YkuD
MELFFRVNGYDSMHMEVVVGKTIRQTPSLSARMANVVLNPTWGVPPTIMKKDVLPGMAKSGKAYLRKKGLKVYDFKGKAVDASAVNSNNYKRYVFRQDAGDDNSLGYVKFNLPNKWDIYLHDTPHRGDFGKKDRFQSSGCIRVQQPKEMAEFILATLEGKRYTRERIDSVIETHKTRYEVLKNRIPVHIVYLTAFEDSTNTRFHFIYDMYKRDGRLKAALGN